MSGRRSRRKGAAFEREVVHELRELWPDARRGLQSQSGAIAADIEGTPYRIECKVGAQPNVLSALEQVLADRAASDDDRPVVVIARRNQRTADGHVTRPRRDVAVMLLDEWLEVLAELENARRAYRLLVRELHECRLRLQYGQQQEDDQ